MATTQRPSLFEFHEATEIPVGPSGLADELLRDILSRRNRAVEKVASGGCKTMESYADSVGYIRAMDYVLGFAERKRAEVEGPQSTPVEDFDP